MSLRRVSIGDRVHFYQNENCYAAIVVKVWTPDCVNLFVFPTGVEEPVPGALSANRNAMDDAMNVPYSDSAHPKDWSWHWPKDNA
jgi:hypothetical protein